MTDLFDWLHRSQLVDFDGPLSSQEEAVIELHNLAEDAGCIDAFQCFHLPPVHPAHLSVMARCHHLSLLTEDSSNAVFVELDFGSSFHLIPRVKHDQFAISVSEEVLELAYEVVLQVRRFDELGQLVADLVLVVSISPSNPPIRCS